MKKKILILMVGFLLIGFNLYAAGDLTVKGKTILDSNVGGAVTLTNQGSGMFAVENVAGGVILKMMNAQSSNPIVFELKADQGLGGHFDTIPAGNFEYWLFGNSLAGNNRAFKVCGYPSAAASNQCVSLKIDGANNDLNMTTDGTNSDILLMPQANVGIGTSSPAYPLEMASGAHVTAGGVWTDVSSREYKENIKELSANKAAETLKGLNPVEFNYKVDKEEGYVGFIAEDVPGLVATKDRKGLSPMDIVAVLTKVVKEQQKTMSEMKEEIKELKREIKLKNGMAMTDTKTY